ncbi:hypothetical protein BDV34DRAFT_151984 [Aspergillus parasiticus]|uniref:Uncharacterized protein n=1 Tax=Aspergillus parasiticus TaxID=5067 RepID=A0A5N6DYX8_ASPPA|nr:hypothetical protein BDV34DRAFT_151984 [Aspergillus parasiticus]
MGTRPVEPSTSDCHKISCRNYSASWRHLTSTSFQLHTQVTDRLCLNICISNGDQQSLKTVVKLPRYVLLGSWIHCSGNTQSLIITVRRRNYAHFPADSPVHETRNVWSFFSY